MFTLMIIYSASTQGAMTSQLKDFATKDEADAVAASLRERANQIAGYLTIIKLYEV
jgi:hypothetical protein